VHKTETSVPSPTMPALLTTLPSGIRSLTKLAPRRASTLTGAQEVECGRYIELLGTLHVQTQDGRRHASFSAPLRVQSTGDTIVTLSDKPLQFFAPPWSQRRPRLASARS
jgi:hypothetical protein